MSPKCVCEGATVLNEKAFTLRPLKPSISIVSDVIPKHSCCCLVWCSGYRPCTHTHTQTHLQALHLVFPHLSLYAEGLLLWGVRDDIVRGGARSFGLNLFRGMHAEQMLIVQIRVVVRGDARSFGLNLFGGMRAEQMLIVHLRVVVRGGARGFGLKPFGGMHAEQMLIVQLRVVVRGGARGFNLKPFGGMHAERRLIVQLHVIVRGGARGFGLKLFGGMRAQQMLVMRIYIVARGVHSEPGLNLFRSMRAVVRVGKNRIITPYMTVHLVTSLPKLPYLHRIHTWFCPTRHIYNNLIRHMTQPM